jgi:solute:Na+ symporter, SSS family
MNWLDWLVLTVTTLFIVLYGAWKTRGSKSVESYLLGDRELKWWVIGVSIMATQASGITFLSTPGQAYADGMRFAQFYIGLPIAMVILAVFVIPIYYRLKVYTAYEYLEQRFDLRTRTLTAILFLVQRGMAAGITIYAPAIILATIMGWSLGWTIFLTGALVVAYTVVGGTNAVSETQVQQMAIILVGMVIAFFIILSKLPPDVAITDAVRVAGKMGKMNIIDFKWDLENRYTFWSGIIGGTFLFLSYFGTDQSQVQRYLSGKTLTESRLGLLFNGMIKVPMQLFILFTGIMVYVFYQYNQPPIHFNETNYKNLLGTKYEPQLHDLETKYTTVFEQKKIATSALANALRSEDIANITTAQTAMKDLEKEANLVRSSVKSLIKTQNPAAETNDTDYVFLSFVTHNFPNGLIGLLIAVIFAASMSSAASEINALATTTVIDIYKRSLVTNRDDAHYLWMSKWFTVIWGVLALGFAAFASLFENLIQAVNIIGSLFYGTILGIFLVAFFINAVKGRAVFYAAMVSEALVLGIFALEQTGQIKMAFLWLNLIGCILVIICSLLLQIFHNHTTKAIRM